MSIVKGPSLTVEDYRLLPATGPRYQLIEGDLHMAPAPNRYHQDISLNIEWMLARYLTAHPIGRIYHAPFDVYLSRTNVFQPDIVFVSSENCWILTDDGAEGSPDLVVEILSERTADLDKKPKRRVYARYGVKELWLVDPDTKRIDVYHLQEDSKAPAASHGERDTFTSECFPGLKISATKVFKR